MPCALFDAFWLDVCRPSSGRPWLSLCKSGYPRAGAARSRDRSRVVMCGAIESVGEDRVVDGLPLERADIRERSDHARETAATLVECRSFGVVTGVDRRAAVAERVRARLTGCSSGSASIVSAGSVIALAACMTRLCEPPIATA